jgi:DNA repair exonuclease SbcCD ATPase subunit
MRTVFSIFLTILFCSPAARAQAPSTDARTLQSILEEVRQLRQDIQATAATVQRAQILIYRLRIQMDFVARATERLEQAHNQVKQIAFQRNQINAQLKNEQEMLERTQDASAREQIEGSIENTKRWLEQMVSGEPEAQTKEMEYASQLRLEQEKLDDLQAQLDRLDKKLETTAGQTGSTSKAPGTGSSLN